MRLAGIPVREVMDQLNIRNKTPVETWMRWYRSGQTDWSSLSVNNTATVKALNMHQSWKR